LSKIKKDTPKKVFNKEQRKEKKIVSTNLKYINHNLPNSHFSRGVIISFKYAFEGLFYVLRTQKHMRFHFMAAILALIVGMWAGLSKLEVLFLFFTISLVLVAEMLNTCLEAMIDMVTDEFHPLAKITKDVAAGGVMIASINAIVVGVMLFLPKVGRVLLDLWNKIFRQ